MARGGKGNETRSRAGGARRAPSRARLRRVPIWKELLRIAKSIPKADLHKLPTDGDEHHDHYLYGSRLS
jgi:hypothetical protein